MSPFLHKILLRQLRRLKLDPDSIVTDQKVWADFLKLVSDTYLQADMDRNQNEHTLDVLSKEMQEKYRELQILNSKLVSNAKLASIGTVASSIAHELNNPLGALKGYLEVILENPGEDSVTLYLGKLMLITDKMTSIVKNLRQMSYQSNKVEWEAFPLKVCVQNAMIITQSKLEKLNVEVSIECDGAPFVVKGDRNQIESIFQNLLSNSIDAFAQNGIETCKIEIFVTSKKDRVLFQYTDNAGGISQEIIHRIFDPFFTTKTVNFGTGLGLALCKQIMTDHEGSISVVSQNGRSEFSLDFLRYLEEVPLVKEEVFSTSKIQMSEGLKLKKFKRILVVDDDSDLLDILQIWFFDIFEIAVFNNISDAKQEFQRGTFDCVLTDLKMPAGDGIALIRHIRLELGSNVPILLMSGHAEFDPELNKAMKSGASDFISKPFESKKVIIEKILRLIEFSEEMAS